MSDLFKKMYRLQYDFYEDMNTVYTSGFLQTLAIPSIAKILKKTGKITRQTLKRDNDTRAVLTHIFKHFGTHQTGKEAMAYMNRAHSAYQIRQDDYTYVLGIYVTLFVDWCEAGNAWRTLTNDEKQNWLMGWISIGQNMGIEQIPTTYAGFHEFMHQYEEKNLFPTTETKELGPIYLDMSVNRHYWFLRPLMRVFYLCSIDARYLHALNLPVPSSKAHALTRFMLRVRRTVVPIQRHLILTYAPWIFKRVKAPELPEHPPAHSTTH